MNPSMPYASLSLDLDNRWSYLKTHGDPGWQSFPSYLDVVVPRVLDTVLARNWTITFFVVGRDATLRKNRDAIRAIARAGHEIGNHSFEHNPWLHLSSEAEIDSELRNAEWAIADVTGQRPCGFRGPGFVHSETILRTLMRRDYHYDASTFPTFTGPLARWYYFMSARLEADEKKLRAQLFGTWREGVRPLRPYRWQYQDRTLIEIPVTTMPLSRLPIHASYILYMSGFSEKLALAYFAAALQLCRAARIAPSVLLHPLDFLGREDAADLSFFPGMGLSRARKLATMAKVFDALSERFEIITVGEHAYRASSLADIPEFDIGPERRGRAMLERPAKLPAAGSPAAVHAALFSSADCVSGETGAAGGALTEVERVGSAA